MVAGCWCARRPVLLASRPVGKVYAGYWEFPGGKIEPGEAPYAALVRELQKKSWPSPSPPPRPGWCSSLSTHTPMCAALYRVSAWQGEPQAQEGQQLNWQTPASWTWRRCCRPTPHPARLVAAGHHCADLRRRTGRNAVLAALPARLAAGLSLLIVREPDYACDQLASWVARLVELTRPAGCRLLVNAEPDWLAGWPVDGVHLNSARLAACRQRPDFAWWALRRIARKNCNTPPSWGWITPRWAMAAHRQPPGRAAAGWQGLACQLASAGPRLPVYALGT